MVLTPRQRPADIRDSSLSPLILPTNPDEPSSATTPATSTHQSTSPKHSASFQQNGTSFPPPIRRFSSSSFSKLSEFNLDSSSSSSSYFPDIDGLHVNGENGDIKEPRAGPSRQNSTNSTNGVENGVKGVRYVDLSLDPSEWRHPVFKQKVLSVLKRLVSRRKRGGGCSPIPSPEGRMLEADKRIESTIME